MRLLEVGDVIRLVLGMKVYATVPDSFIYASRRYSPLSQTTEGVIRIGSLLKNGLGDTFDTIMFAGEYVVIDTDDTGGSHGHGEHFYHPSGQRVVAQRLSKDGTYDENGVVVSFYQNGPFKALIEPDEIAPIRKMRRIFV
jgi:hypothetical protein